MDGNGARISSTPLVLRRVALGVLRGESGPAMHVLPKFWRVKKQKAKLY
jgi:hypothetical protein